MAGWKRRLEQLIANHFQARQFFWNGPPWRWIRTGLPAWGMADGLPHGPGTVIGPYKLLEQIGEGGMGVVYMAEQTARSAARWR